jgi:hypothetical protein
LASAASGKKLATVKGEEMAVEDITNPEWVRMAMAEYHRLGEQEFLDSYGFRRSTKFDVLDTDGKKYPPKAILGVAHKFTKKGAKALTTHQLNGGEPTNAPLRELGFAVVLKSELLAPDVADKNPFNPTDIKDARQRIERTIVQRRGQTVFRKTCLTLMTKSVRFPAVTWRMC